jgi:hypothetical protein
MKTKFKKPARRNGRAQRRRALQVQAPAKRQDHPGLSREALQRIVYELIG